MNSNKATVIILSIVGLLVIVMIFNLNRSKSIQYEYDFEGLEFMVGESLMANIQSIPKIIRSYETVKEYYGYRNILIFRYIQNTCNTCLDSQLNELLAFQEEIGKEFVWVFPVYPDDRNLMIKISAELGKFNYRNIPAKLLLIPTYNGEPQSYFAGIDGEGDITMVFVPDKGNVFHTCRYFGDVKRI